jgi:hypothetical protein
MEKRKQKITDKRESFHFRHTTPGAVDVGVA